MKELTSKGREIAKAIIFAQLASDGGKKVYDLIDEVDCKGARKCFDRGYASKDANILKAIDLINKGMSEEVAYYVCRDLDQNGYDSYVVYFAFRLNGTRHQVSFHSPARGCSFLERYCDESHRTRWDDRVPSRQNCLRLAERFGWA